MWRVSELTSIVWLEKYLSQALTHNYLTTRESTPVSIHAWDMIVYKRAFYCRHDLLVKACLFPLHLCFLAFVPAEMKHDTLVIGSYYFNCFGQTKIQKVKTVYIVWCSMSLLV